MSKRLTCIVTGLVLSVFINMNWLGSGAAIFAQDDPAELVYGQTVEGTINESSPSAFYRFEGDAGDVITATMILTDGELDPFLVLNDAQRVPLATDDNGGGSTNARLTFTLPAAGEYLLQATHSGGTPPEAGGTFSLNLTASLASDEPPAQTEASPGAHIGAIQLGATTTGQLDRSTAVKLYWFNAGAGQTITATVAGEASFTPIVSLYDNAMQQVARAQDGQPLTHTLESPGIYFIAVSVPDTGSAGGSFTLQLDAGIASEQGDFETISNGDRLAGTVSEEAPAVTYAFDGSEGDNITITMSRTGGDLDSYLYLLDASGSTLYEDNDSGGDTGDAWITYTLPADGQYLIIATRADQEEGVTTGGFLLELLSDSPAPSASDAEPTLPAAYATAPVLGYGDEVEGEITNTKHLDLYTFVGSAGDTVLIEMNSPTIDTPDGLDPLLILLDSQQIPLSENDDIVAGVERNSRITYTLPTTGYYAIVATRFEQADGTTTGPYTLTLNNVDPNSVTTPEIEPIAQLDAQPLILGVPIQGALNNGGAIYTLDVEENGILDLSLTSDSELATMAILVDANLSEIASATSDTISSAEIQGAGSYGVIVFPQIGAASSRQGGYILAVTATGESSPTDSGEAAADSTPISYGTTVQGVIDDENPAQRYVFTGSANQFIQIEMTAAAGSSLDCYVELQTIDGTPVAANDDIDPGRVRDSRLTTELPSDGAYIIIASRYVGDDAPITTGAFNLTLEQVDEQSLGVSDEIIPIAYGETLTNQINDEQYLVFYSFDASAGDIISIEIEHLSGNLDTVLFLYQSSGENWRELASNDDSPTGGTYEAMLSNITLPQTGKYLIAVSRYGLETENYFGDFNITLRKEN